MMRRHIGLIGGLVIVSLLVGVGLWKTYGTPIAVIRRPEGIMGTSCTLVAIVPRHRQADGLRALRDAETRLRNLEARLSSWIEVSEISQFNAAAAGETVRLSHEARHVLDAAYRAYGETAGAFDVTCRPLIELWRDAGQKGHMPDQQAIEKARSDSNWEMIERTETGAWKHVATARVDLGGIAKGYAIDEAVSVLRDADISGGLVDVGGDERFFGQSLQGKPWSTSVKNSYGDGLLVELPAREMAVCTSGNYARYSEIDGRRYSHIIDPRTGEPALHVVSVTVRAPSALRADIWATALSVLGPVGMESLPKHVDAFMVHEGPSGPQAIATPALRKYVEEAEAILNKTKY